jgi:hypothetical protein
MLFNFLLEDEQGLVWGYLMSALLYISSLAIQIIYIDFVQYNRLIMCAFLCFRYSQLVLRLTQNSCIYADH